MACQFDHSKYFIKNVVTFFIIHNTYCSVVEVWQVDMIFFKYELFYDDVTFPLKSRDTVQVWLGGLLANRGCQQSTSYAGLLQYFWSSDPFVILHTVWVNYRMHCCSSVSGQMCIIFPDPTTHQTSIEIIRIQ